MNEQLISHIEELGLSNKEARVYVACLLTGPAAVQRIADQAGIKRVTTYVILESLVGLGLVSQSVKGKKTMFIAEEPTNLRRLLEKRTEELKEQKSNFEAILPELEALKTLPGDSPNVKFFDSADGIKTIMTTFLASHRHELNEDGVVYGISNLDQLYNFFPDFVANSGNPSRLQEQIPSQFIYATERGPILKATDKEKRRVSRWVPVEEFPLNGDITVVGDHVIMLSLTGSKPLGITIDSQEIAAGLRGVFELAWRGAEKYNEKEPN